MYGTQLGKDMTMRETASGLPLVITTIAICFQGLAPAYADEKTDALLKEVETATKAAKTLTAELSLSQSAQGQSMKSTGTIKLKKPNMARISLGKPVGQTIASDGKDLFTLRDGMNQYQKMAPGAFGSNIQALWALPINVFFAGGLVENLGIGGLKFANPALVGNEKRDGTEYQVLQTVNGPDGAQKFRFFVAPSKLITGVAIEMKQGQNTIKYDAFLSNVKVGQEIANANFTFVPPATAKLYEAPNYEAKLLKAGVEAPPFELKSPKDGSPISLGKALDGRKAVLVNFWFYN
jgi:outer membrane lipoprotein-sorting protein